jgi:hypothetical protein
MVLSDKQIKAFQEVYKKEFGKEIGTQEAYEQATRLLRLVSLLLYKSEYAKYPKEDEDTKREICF